MFIDALCTVAKTTKMPCKGWMDKQAGVHAYKGILSGHEEKRAHKPEKAMDEPQMYVSKWMKPISKGYVLYDSNYRTY